MGTTVTGTGVVTTPSSLKDFDFYDHVLLRSLLRIFTITFSCCPLYKSNPENSIKRSIIKQKEKSGEIAFTNIFFL